MRKFLLTAIVAMLGMSAFAQAPTDGAIGYLYNPEAKVFISGDITDGDGKLHATTGTTGLKFKAIDTGSNYFRFETEYIQTIETSDGGQGKNCRLSRCSNNAEDRITTSECNGWSKWLLKVEEGKGFRITNNYGGTAANFAKGTTCITIQEDGTLTLVAEADAPYWLFVDQATYDELTAVVELNTNIPSNDAIGYLYNPEAKVFISGDITDGDGKLHATTGATGLKFKAIDTGSNYFRFETEYIQTIETSDGGQGKNCRLSRCSNNAEDRITTSECNGWSKWLLKVEEGKGFRITNNYGGTAANFAKGTTCITIQEDGTLTLVAEADAPCWVFVDQETYDKLVPASEPEPIVVTFDFTKSNHAVSSGSGETYVAAGDITATETLTQEGVTLTISPAEEGKTTPNRYWTYKNAPQLRMYSGYMTLTAPEGKAITEIAIDNIKWNTDNKFNGVAAAAGAWAGNCSVVAIDIAGNTQMNSIVVTLADADEGTTNVPTEISSVTKKVAQKGIFNMAGQQMNGLQKGLNIVDGKKVLVK